MDEERNVIYNGCGRDMLLVGLPVWSPDVECFASFAHCPPSVILWHNSWIVIVVSLVGVCALAKPFWQQTA